MIETRSNILAALWSCKPILEAVPVDRTMAKPKVSIIGEFWAMTTEGDGNYQLQRFLESEGAEADIQLVTAWILYMLWEGRRDTQERKDLRGERASSEQEADGARAVRQSDWEEEGCHEA